MRDMEETQVRIAELHARLAQQKSGETRQGGTAVAHRHGNVSLWRNTSVVCAS
jgi:hypothetical protein